MIQNIIGGELGSQSVMLSSLQRSKMEAIANEASNIEIPAMVGFTEKERHFSEQCLVKLKRNFKTSIVQLINLIGNFDEKELLYQYADKIENKDNKFFFPNINQKSMNPEKNIQQGINAVQALGAYIHYLEHLISKKNQGKQNFYSIFSVPSHFNPFQKKLVEQAFSITKFPLAKVIEEHSAICYSYVYLKKKELAELEEPKNVLFIDIGYSKTNIFAVQFIKDEGKVVYLNCQKGLGVRTIDNILYQKVGDKFQEKFGNFPKSNKKVQLRILEAVEKHRKILSTNTETSIDIECLYEEEDISFPISREEFEKYIKSEFIEILKKELQAAQKFLSKKKFAFADIEIMGGGVRIPIVKKLLYDTFKVEKLCQSMSIESISRGCTVSCAQYASLFNPLVKVETYTVYNVSSNDYKIQTIVNGNMIKEEKVSKNTPLPLNLTRQLDLNTYDQQNLKVQLKLILEENDQEISVLDVSKNSEKRVRIEQQQQQQQQQQENKMEVESEKKEDKMEEEEEVKEEKQEEQKQQEQQQQLPQEETEESNKKNKVQNLTINYCLNDDQVLDIRQCYESEEYLNQQDQKIEFKTQYDVHTTYQGLYNKDEIQVFAENEKEQQGIDQEIVVLNDQRNNFEKLIYDYKRTLNDELKLQLSEQEMTDLNKVLQQNQEWFEANAYETELTSQTIIKQIDELTKVFTPYVESLKMTDLMTQEVKNVDDLKKLKGQTISSLLVNLRNQDIGDGSGFFGFFKKGAAKIAELINDINIHQKVELDIGNANLSDSGVMALFNCVSKKQDLKQLVIDLESSQDSKYKNNLTVECLDSMNAMIVAQRGSLEKFSLCMKVIFEEDFANLSQILAQSPKLKYVKIQIKRGQISQALRDDFRQKMKGVMKFDFQYYNENGQKEN